MIALRKFVRRARNVARRSGLRVRDRLLPTYAFPDGCDDTLARLVPLAGEPVAAPAPDAVRMWCANTFDILGSGWTALGARIDWQQDFKSGHRWNVKTWYRDIAYGPGADIKVPWELSRMQHLPLLAAAFRDSHDGRLPSVFAAQVGDWIAENPPRFGVNWASTMEVGIRVANWLYAYDVFRAAGASFDRAFERRFVASVHDHARHIVQNLEWAEDRRANHYFGNVAGLLFAAAYLPSSPRTDAWLAFAVQELVAETERQFLPDGGHFEASTSYHRLCGEMAVAAAAACERLDAARVRALLAAEPRRMRYGPGLRRDALERMRATHQATGRLLPPSFFARLRTAAAFTRALTRPDGRVVQIGDNDSGRFLQFDTNRPGDHSQWLAWATALAGRPEGPTPHTVVARAPELRVVHRLATVRETGPGLLRGLELAAFPHFGAYIVRSERLFAVVRCGSALHDGCGAHAHDDQLSVELVVDGQVVAEDPGTFTYTADPGARNLYRSAAVHAAPCVVAPESDAGRRVFGPPRVTRGICVRFDASGFVGHAPCGDGTVVRSVRWSDDRIEVVDEYDSAALPLQSDPLVPARRVATSPAYGVRAA